MAAAIAGKPLGGGEVIDGFGRDLGVTALAVTEFDVLSSLAARFSGGGDTDKAVGCALVEAGG